METEDGHQPRTLRSVKHLADNGARLRYVIQSRNDRTVHTHAVTLLVLVLVTEKY